MRDENEHFLLWLLSWRIPCTLIELRLFLYLRRLNFGGATILYNFNVLYIMFGLGRKIEIKIYEAIQNGITARAIS